MDQNKTKNFLTPIWEHLLQHISVKLNAKSQLDMQKDFDLFGLFRVLGYRVYRTLLNWGFNKLNKTDNIKLDVFDM